MKGMCGRRWICKQEDSCSMKEQLLIFSIMFLILSSQLVSADGSQSDSGSVCADNQSDLPPPIERTGGIGDSRPPSFQ